MAPKELADALLRVGYGRIAHDLQKIDRLLYYDEEVSDQLDTEETAEKIADILTDISIAIKNA